jgi:hypothetical protein
LENAVARDLLISEKEVEKKKNAVPDTRKKARTLQKQLAVPIDQSILINRTTAAAITGAFELRGFIKLK